MITKKGIVTWKYRILWKNLHLHWITQQKLTCSKTDQPKKLTDFFLKNKLIKQARIIPVLTKVGILFHKTKSLIFLDKFFSFDIMRLYFYLFLLYVIINSLNYKIETEISNERFRNVIYSLDSCNYQKNREITWKDFSFKHSLLNLQPLSRMVQFVFIGLKQI